MQNPEVEFGSIKEKLYMQTFMRKEEEDFMKNLMLVKAAQDGNVRELLDNYMSQKFPWMHKIKRMREKQALEMLEDERGKAYKVSKLEAKVKSTTARR